jgi:hypothetical protein
MLPSRHASESALLPYVMLPHAMLPHAMLTYVMLPLLSPRSTQKLLQAMRAAGSLNELSLDLQHGASYHRPRTATELDDALALTFLGSPGVGKGTAS